MAALLRCRRREIYHADCQNKTRKELVAINQMEEFLHKALFVEDVDDDCEDLNSVPTSGQEYLKRVM